jgi:hypothetical protein
MKKLFPVLVLVAGLCLVFSSQLTVLGQNLLTTIQPVTPSGTFAVTANAGTNLNTSALALDASLSTLDTDLKANIVLAAGTHVIGHVIADTGSTTAVTGNVAMTVADGADVTLGAKADNKSTATDTTAVSIVALLKEISAMLQAPAALATGTNTVGSVKQTDGTTIVLTDPCQGVARTNVSFNQTTGTQILGLSGSSKKYYICSINLMSATAQNVAIVDSTTAGNVCATSPSGSDGFGGSTAATGYNLAANGGLVNNGGGYQVGSTHNTNAALCILQSSSGQISGGMSYVAQ